LLTNYATSHGRSFGHRRLSVVDVLHLQHHHCVGRPLW
jgi:hypothetical protein